MALTKKEIASSLVAEVGLSHVQALSVVNEFFAQISQTLTRDESVKLSGFGNFSVRDKKARPGRNPKTGEPCIISPRKVVAFKAGLKLKTATQKSE